MAIHKLKQAGFTDVVIATDHGFFLNAQAEAGDVCAKPAGTWIVVHDRALLGEGEPDAAISQCSREGRHTRRLREAFAGPRSMAPYRRGLLYFHGGASLQEAIVPVITVRLKQAKQPQMAAAKVRCPTRMARSGLRPGYRWSTCRRGRGHVLARRNFEILLEAHDKKGKIVGEAKRGGPSTSRPGRHAEARGARCRSRSGWPWSSRASSR